MKKTILYGAIIALLLGAIDVGAFNLKSFNFGVVNKGILYRSAAPSEEFFERTIEKYKIKTLVVFEERISDFEKRISRERGITIVHLPFAVDQDPPTEYINLFLKLVKEEGRAPILARCQAGADRTGVMIAIKRIEIDGWSVCDAWNEVLHYRNIPLFTPMPTRYLEKRYGVSCPLQQFIQEGLR